MKTVAFHSNQLGLRGTEVALYDYAHYNETILSNKSYIFADANLNLDALEKFKKRFGDRIFLYNKFEDCIGYTQNNKIGYVYYIKAGDDDGKVIPGVKNAIHAVFQTKEIHGDSYAYVSKWLATKMGMEGCYVPHIVSLPEPEQNYRQLLNIPQDNIVVGRHGGYGEFDLPFVYSEIYNILQTRKDITFLFMNTKPFGPEHPNIIYVNGTHNLQNKSNFINTCDYMIHARYRGESFGLAICEFLYNGRPVISWKNGLDQHHVDLLQHDGIWYNNANQLNQIFANLTRQINSSIYRKIVEQFSPKLVMEQFNSTFLD